MRVWWWWWRGGPDEVATAEKRAAALPYRVKREVIKGSKVVAVFLWVKAFVEKELRATFYLFSLLLIGLDILGQSFGSDSVGFLYLGGCFVFVACFFLFLMVFFFPVLLLFVLCVLSVGGGQC